MTTVGFGDFYPKTHLGRVIIIMSCIWGIYSVSLMVLALSNASDFTTGQLKAYELLHRVKGKKTLQKKAAEVLWAMGRWKA